MFLFLFSDFYKIKYAENKKKNQGACMVIIFKIYIIDFENWWLETVSGLGTKKESDFTDLSIKRIN